ncbi:TPA: hypothetical protein N0F65_009953 [Lagenidium giganteum]|uniref:Uncharacterized protein n=1 Tax=Lagenidium giganteum TaxID=4803 RepID=A0AAV2YTQ6_9STRA|nr:TPA: hypothetical protein N0F65_009953 [Lagenidium giganteum]
MQEGSRDGPNRTHVERKGELLVWRFLLACQQTHQRRKDAPCCTPHKTSPDTHARIRAATFRDQFCP